MANSEESAADIVAIRQLVARYCHAGVYDDRLRRVEGQWLFVERRFTRDREPEE